jgi:hypothetical protein
MASGSRRFLRSRTPSANGPGAEAGSPGVINPAVWCPVVELRRYALHPGRREELIRLFEEQLIEPQEAVGLTVMGQFRDLDDPDSFVWLRGFRRLGVRAGALSAFYDGPIWARYRDQANATMVSSDNVLLLRPARPGSGFSEAAEVDSPSARPRRHRQDLLVAMIYLLRRPAEEGFLAFFEQDLAPALHKVGASDLAWYVTDPSENDFPRLPVRENDPVLVSFSRFTDPKSFQGFSNAARQMTPASRLRLVQFLKVSPEVLRLAPTARSRLPA